MGVAVGDYDNDGWEDLYVTAYGGNKLYHNNGDGTFTDVTAQAGVAGGGWSTSAAWVDLDGDGLLDLVVARYLQWDFDDIWCGEHKEGFRSYCHPDQFQAIAPLVYHNDGHGHFTEVAQQSGFAKPGKGVGGAIADFNRDGCTDVFIANDAVPQFLYQSNGNGTFEEVGLASQSAVDGDGHPFSGMGVDLADYNNDGLPDLVVRSRLPDVRALPEQRRWNLRLCHAPLRPGTDDAPAFRLGSAVYGLRQRRLERSAHRAGACSRYGRDDFPTITLPRTDVSCAEHRHQICGCLGECGNRVSRSLGQPGTGG